MANVKQRFVPLNMQEDPLHASYRVRTLDEAKELGTIISTICPNQSLASIGIIELLINAIEHGNLGITFDEKMHLYKKHIWLDEIQRRLELPENIDKQVAVELTKQNGMITIRITDQGNGFDWESFQSMDIKDIYAGHGRGLVIARFLSFQEMNYHGVGNDVECMISYR